MNDAAIDAATARRWSREAKQREIDASRKLSPAEAQHLAELEAIIARYR